MKRLIIFLVAISLVALPMFAADDAAALFQSKCAMCHGKTGAGDTSIGKSKGLKDFSSADVQKLTDEELITLISDGGPNKTASHAFKAKGLTDDQIKGLVAFIRTLKK